LSALIWGFAFVAQKEGMQYIGPFLFNAIRFLMGSFFLILLFIRKFKKLNKEVLIPGIILGLVLFAGSTFQQVGIVYTQAANAGFITSLYIIFIPIIGLFFKRKTGFHIWFSILLALVGFSLMSLDFQTLKLSFGDLLVFICSIFWAIHVSLIESYAKLNQSIVLAATQFMVSGLLSLIVALTMEPINIHSIQQAWIPIAFAGIFSAGVAFTLQIYAQQFVPANVAGVLFSSESLFALIGGIFILNEQMSFKEILGCAFILSGIILVQLFQNIKSRQRLVNEVKIK
jgi:drug/metabolite transporter (DMT)-like permease